MRENDHSYFQNRQCKYFPCHTVEDEDEFNCLFCYCPLYMLGDKCGGNFVYTERGIKNCRNCANKRGLPKKNWPGRCMCPARLSPNGSRVGDTPALTR